MTAVLVAVVAVLMGAVLVYYVVHGKGAIVRDFHCNACGKDFQLDLSKPGLVKPTCPYCSSSDIKMTSKEPASKPPAASTSMNS